MKNTSNQSLRKWSLISGISLLIMALAAGIAYGFILTNIYIPGNRELTLTNIKASQSLYDTGILLWIVILATDLLVTYGFYRFLKSIHPSVAVVSGSLRLVYSLTLIPAIVFLTLKNPAQFERIWSLGLIVFGFHLTATGMGTFASREVPKIIGILLIIAGCSYSLIHGIYNFLPQLTNLGQIFETYLALPMTLGELSFGIWLMVKGGKKISPQLSDGPVPGGL